VHTTLLKQFIPLHEFACTQWVLQPPFSQLPQAGEGRQVVSVSPRRMCLSALQRTEKRWRRVGSC